MHNFIPTYPASSQCTRSQYRVRGFSLVEVTLALAIAAFVLVIILGLLPTGLRSNQVSHEEFEATNFLSGIVADLRNTPPNASQSPIYALPMTSSQSEYSALISADDRIVTSNAAARYRVTIRYTSTPNPADSFAPVEASVSVSWPPNLAIEEAKHRVETYVTLLQN